MLAGLRQGRTEELRGVINKLHATTYKDFFGLWSSIRARKRGTILMTPFLPSPSFYITCQARSQHYQVTELTDELNDAREG